MKEVDRSVQLYNCEKPHKALGRVSPVNFEKDIFNQGKHPTVRSQRRNTNQSTEGLAALRAEGKHPRAQTSLQNMTKTELNSL